MTGGSAQWVLEIWYGPNTGSKVAARRALHRAQRQQSRALSVEATRAAPCGPTGGAVYLFADEAQRRIYPGGSASPSQQERCSSQGRGTPCAAAQDGDLPRARRGRRGSCRSLGVVFPFKGGGLPLNRQVNSLDCARRRSITRRLPRRSARTGERVKGYSTGVVRSDQSVSRAANGRSAEAYPGTPPEAALRNIARRRHRLALVAQVSRAPPPGRRRGNRPGRSGAPAASAEVEHCCWRAARLAQARLSSAKSPTRRAGAGGRHAWARSSRTIGGRQLADFPGRRQAPDDRTCWNVRRTKSCPSARPSAPPPGPQGILRILAKHPRRRLGEGRSGQHRIHRHPRVVGSVRQNREHEAGGLAGAAKQTVGSRLGRDRSTPTLKTGTPLAPATTRLDHSGRRRLAARTPRTPRLTSVTGVSPARRP